MKSETVREKWNTYDSAGIGSGGYTDEELLHTYIHGDVLELGCGRGDLLAGLQNAKSKKGIDLSESAIATAKANHPEIPYFVADVCALPFPDESFDVVYSLEVIEHVQDYRKMLSEIKRVLRPGGVAYLQTPNYPIKRVYDLLYYLFGRRYSWRDDYTHVSLFSFSRLTKEVAREFSIVTVRTRNILLENKLTPLKRLRTGGSFFGLLLGQKTIVVAQKSRPLTLGCREGGNLQLAHEYDAKQKREHAGDDARKNGSRDTHR